jgi:hypothetical protein
VGPRLSNEIPVPTILDNLIARKVKVDDAIFTPTTAPLSELERTKMAEFAWPRIPWAQSE